MAKIDAPEHRSVYAGGKSDHKWSRGPYVKKRHRQLWNDFFVSFADELCRSAGYPKGVVIPAETIQTLAWNLAYLAIWELDR